MQGPSSTEGRPSRTLRERCLARWARDSELVAQAETREISSNCTITNTTIENLKYIVHTTFEKRLTIRTTKKTISRLKTRTAIGSTCALKSHACGKLESCPKTVSPM